MNHLVKAKHKEVILHKEGALGETIPECTFVYSTMLASSAISPGLMRSELILEATIAGARMSSCWASFPPRATLSSSSSAGESKHLILPSHLLGTCDLLPVDAETLMRRQPCAALTNSRDINWDTSQWSAIIDDRQFLSWLVKVPSEAEQLRARQVSISQISKLEDMWRENPDARLEDAEAGVAEEEMQPVLMR